MNLTKYIGEQFGNPTGIGGKLSTFIMNRINQKQYASVVQVLGIKPNDTVLDVGFGNGYLLHKLAGHVPAHLEGIDTSADMLRAARKRNRKFIRQGKMQLQTGDVTHMDFEGSFFDKIYTVNTIYFWQDINEGLSEIRRVLKPGGIFVNAVYSKEFLNRLRYTNYGFTKYTEEELKSAAEQNHFEITEIITIEERVAYCYVLKKTKEPSPLSLSTVNQI